MTDILGEFAAMNEVYRQYFPVGRPARSTVGVLSLARPGLKIEMEAILSPRIDGHGPMRKTRFILNALARPNSVFDRTSDHKLQRDRTALRLSEGCAIP